MSVRGVHIVFEGPDAAGKSTQIARTHEYLLKNGYNVTLTREPGGTPTGALLRTILLDSDVEIDPKAEALMMAADRAQDVAQVILPALVRGDVVLSDRYIPSSLVYQGIVRGLGVEQVQELSTFAVGDHRPDLTLCFDIPDHIAHERIGDEPDRIEQEGQGFHQKIREAYRQLTHDFSWSAVDAYGSEDEVFARIIDLITPVLIRNAG